MEIQWNCCFLSQDPCQKPWVRVNSGLFFRPERWLFTAISLAILMADFTLAASQLQAMEDRTVAKVVDDFFTSQPDYEHGDLITRSQIEKVLSKLAGSGVKVPEPSSIAGLGLPDNSFLVRELSTPSGIRFMRKVSQHSGGYSNLDRLSTIPRGQTLIHDLIHQKDGDKLIEYLATTRGGKNMGAMMGNVRGGTDLNKPTGRIYTAEELLKVILSAMAKP